MKMRNKSKWVRSALASAVTAAMLGAGPVQAIDWEVWAFDQSNSVAGNPSRGTDGSFLHIFEGSDIQDLAAGNISNPLPLVPCHSGTLPGPCDVHDLFPPTLTEIDESGPTGATLGDVGPIGRLHGGIPDPQHKYVNMNLFAPGKGFVGILDARTKEAVALFRVTATGNGESLHMSFWNNDGSALLLANLHGRILERIDTPRDEYGNIISATFNRAASMGVAATTITSGAKAYVGPVPGAAGITMGTVSAAGYTAEATAQVTPNGYCRQAGCGVAPNGDGSLGGRTGNVIVCPIVSSNNKVFVTFGGGGLLVADADATPMKIVGEYEKNIINGAGCGGVETGGNVYLNAGASASAAGATQSEFTMYRLTKEFPDAPAYYPPNFPAPLTLWKNANNTLSGGATTGLPPNTSGQLPGTTTRSDAHGMVSTTSGAYVHNADRIQNNVRAFNASTGASTLYTLTNGVCAAEADAAVPAAYADDPAPDLMDRDPNGEFLLFAARGPIPVSVTHAAQGACPGAGVIRLTDDGASGTLAAVARTYNTVDTAPASAPGGYAYGGTEHSDPHGVSVIIK